MVGSGGGSRAYLAAYSKINRIYMQKFNHNGQMLLTMKYRTPPRVVRWATDLKIMQTTRDTVWHALQDGAGVLYSPRTRF